MTKQIDIEKLANMIKQKRGNTGLREAAKEIGNISASTLSRIEKGNLPDLDTYMLLCKWLHVSSEEFAIGGNEKKTADSKSKIVAHLRADKNLAPATATALIKMIELAYKNKE